ncbi:hypothetical protein [Syntrophaceticus schinkii]|uniref:hypothetical protein n=1 Tax=Syntrophaceticus schinkii TaxID=499207 RepID=UPI0005CC01F5|nr:hypothetical protein [Syntrophaceticus schinkii]MDD4260776.1 hypothetical protein [Syntrophaceticus schinkii]
MGIDVGCRKSEVGKKKNRGQMPEAKLVVGRWKKSCFEIDALVGGRRLRSEDGKKMERVTVTVV